MPGKWAKTENMNKGLFIHLIVTGLTIIAWLFVVLDEPVTMDARLFLILLLFVTNLITAASCDMNKFYNQKIKL